MSYLFLPSVKAWTCLSVNQTTSQNIRVTSLEVQKRGFKKVSVHRRVPWGCKGRTLGLPCQRRDPMRTQDAQIYVVTSVGRKVGKIPGLNSIH